MLLLPNKLLLTLLGEAGLLLILLCIEGQSQPEDAAWFDDVELYKMP